MERKRFSQRITAILLALSIFLTATIMPNLDEFKVYADTLPQQVSESWTDNYDDRSLFFIGNEADLTAFSDASKSHDFSEKTIYLTNDISITSSFSTDSRNPFKGTLNGNGYTISINTPVSLFGNIDGATFENLNLEINFTGSSLNNGYGAITNSYTKENPVTINNCSVSGNVTISAIPQNGSGYAGFIGSATNTDLSFTNCVSDISISYKNSQCPHLGGFVGSATSTGLSFSDCVSDAKLSASNPDNNPSLGGFVGEVVSSDNPVQFNNCLSVGIFSALKPNSSNPSPAIGGFVGHVDSDSFSVSDSISAVKISNVSTKSGALAGYASSALTTSGFYFNSELISDAVGNSSVDYSDCAKTTVLLTDPESTYLPDWSYIDPLALSEGRKEAYYPLPKSFSGTLNHYSEVIEADSTVLSYNFIRTESQLLAINGSNEKYILLNDIILYSKIDNFSGTLYGNSHKITSTAGSAVFENVNGAYISGLELLCSEAFINNATNLTLRDCVIPYNDVAAYNVFVKNMTGGTISRCASYENFFISNLLTDCTIDNSFCVNYNFVNNTGTATANITDSWCLKNDAVSTFSVSPSNENWTAPAPVSYFFKGEEYVSLPTLTRLYCTPVIVKTALKIIDTDEKMTEAVTAGGEYWLKNGFTPSGPITVENSLILHFGFGKTSSPLNFSVSESATLEICDLTYEGTDPLINGTINGNLVFKNVNLTNSDYFSSILESEEEEETTTSAAVEEETTTSAAVEEETTTSAAVEEETTTSAAVEEETTTTAEPTEETSAESATQETTTAEPAESSQETTTAEPEEETAGENSDEPVPSPAPSSDRTITIYNSCEKSGENFVAYFDNSNSITSEEVTYLSEMVNFLNNGSTTDSTPGVWSTNNTTLLLNDVLTDTITITKPVPLTVDELNGTTITQKYKTAQSPVNKTDSFSGLTYSDNEGLFKTSEIKPTNHERTQKTPVTITLSTTNITLVNRSNNGVAFSASVNGDSTGIIYECLSDTDENTGIAYISETDGKIYPINKGKTRIRVSYPETATTSAAVAYIDVSVETGTFSESDFYINNAPLSDTNLETDIVYTAKNLTGIVTAPNIQGVSFTYKIVGSSEPYAETLPYKNATASPLNVLFKATCYGYYDFEYTKIIRVNIVKADSSVEFVTPSSTIPYSGTPITLSPSVTLLESDSLTSDDTITFRHRPRVTEGENTNAFVDGIPVERGIYDIYATYTPGGDNAVNYKPSTTAEPFVLTITYADYEPALGSIVKTYDNTAPNLNTLSVTPPANSTVKYSIDGVTFFDSVEALGRGVIDVCNKDFYVLVNNYNYNGGENVIYSANLTINKATPVINMTQTSFELSYDRADELEGMIKDKLSVQLVGGEVYNGGYSFEYSVDDGLNWTQGLPGIVGTYKVRITPTGLSGNYNSVYKDVNVVVTKINWPADATTSGLIHIQNLYSYTYDGTTPIPGIIVNEPDYRIEYSLTENSGYKTAENFVCKNSTVNNPDGKVTYYIRIYSDNYNGYFQTHTDVTIAQRPIGLNFTDGFQSTCHTGSAVSVGNPRLTNLADGDNLIINSDYNVTYEYCNYDDMNNANVVYTAGLPVNIGRYHVRAYYTPVSASGRNYKRTAASFILYVYPERFSGVTATGIDCEYDGNPHTISIYGYPSEGSVITYSTSLFGTYSTTPIEFVNVCENVVVYYKVTNRNYVDSETGFDYLLGTATVTIRKASPEIKFISAPSSMTFTGNAPTFNVEVWNGDKKLNNVNVLYSYKIKGATGVNDIEYEGLPVQAGNYEIKAYVDELNDNYNAAENTIDFTIDKAPFTSDLCTIASEIALTYDAGKELEIPFENVPEGTTILYSLEENGIYSAMTFTDACEETTIYFKASNENLEGEKRGSFRLTINKAAPVLSSLSCTRLSKGDPLSGSTISGRAYFTDSEGTRHLIRGTFSWVDSTTEFVPGTSYEFIFTPEDSNYSTVSGNLTPSKKTPVPSFPEPSDDPTDDPSDPTEPEKEPSEEISIIFNNSTTRYTGSEISTSVLDITVSSDNITKNDLTYSFRAYGSDNSFTDGLPKNIGVYEVKARYDEAAATARITVFDDNVEIRSYTGLYDGNPHSISVIVSDGIIVEYKTAGESVYSSLNPQFTEIGNYSVDYRITFPDGKVTEGTAFVTILTDHESKDDEEDVVIEITDGNGFIDDETAKEISEKNGILNIVLPNGIVLQIDCNNALLANNLDFNTKLVESDRISDSLCIDIIFSRRIELGFTANIIIPLNEEYLDKEITLYRVVNGGMEKIEAFEIKDKNLIFSIDSTMNDFSIVVAGASVGQQMPGKPSNPGTGVESDLLILIIGASTGFTVAGLAIRKRKNDKN